MNFGIIAAGEGSRLVQEGVAVPKPLVDIDGRPMIGRLLSIFDDLGAETVSVIVNSHMTEVRDWLRGGAPALKAALRVTVRTTPSSMHSFWHLAETLAPGGRFVLTTVDTVFRERDFRRYVELYENAPAELDGMMAVTTHIDDEKPLYVDTAGGIADGRSEGSRITAFRDTPESGSRFISGGIYGLGPNALRVLGRCIENGVSRMRNYQRALVADGLDLMAFDMGTVLDVDHAGDIAKAREFLRN